MSIESDDDRAVFLETADFGEEAEWTIIDGATATLNGILFRPTTMLDIDAGAPVVLERPTFLCAEVDLPAGAGEGNIIAIVGEFWRVRTLLPDGAGMARAELESSEDPFGSLGLDFSQSQNSQYLPLV